MDSLCPHNHFYNMLTYNTRRPEITLPEYGRNIQQMVAHCMTIEDRDERTRCAYAIVDTIARLQPKLREQPDYKQKLWDQLAVISNWQLDIDWPVQPAGPEERDQRPERVMYPGRHIRQRHYGKDIELMIDQAVTMEDGPAKDELVYMLANHMKKTLQGFRNEVVSDAKVFKDLAEYSHGLIQLDPATTRLCEFNIIAPPTQGKKKKKR